MKALEAEVRIIGDSTDSAALPGKNVFQHSSTCNEMVPKHEEKPVKTNGVANGSLSNGLLMSPKHEEGPLKTNGSLGNGLSMSPKHEEGPFKTNGSLSNGILVSPRHLNVLDPRRNSSDESSNEKHSLESLTDMDLPHRDCGSPPENIPRLQDFHGDSGMESAASSWDRTVVEVKEHAFMRLQEELRKAHEELKFKDEEVNRLSRIKVEVQEELEDLTASLFQEAHNMVKEANIKQASAERALKESVMQVEVLTAEVAALKTLVLTSTPSRPNPHLHPQIDLKGKEETPTTTAGFFRKHRRSPSHFNLKYGRENSPPESPVKDQNVAPPSELVDSKHGLEVDPSLHKEFLAWHQTPSLDKSDLFIARIYKEDIDCCLAFTNTQLSDQVLCAIESGCIFIEAVGDKAKSLFPKKCALLESPRHCHYRMRLGESDTWYYISQICRNRIIAVCDFLNYLKYIQQGLVKSSVHEIYWEIIRLRKEMVLARLGLALSP
uniref:GDP/GTP exchange factor Sec2 N-terminal domain-containing protein n=1 Tax=Clastoptera arizonana TaxID=38151 RepID=A0A1B6CA33_9HEMI